MENEKPAEEEKEGPRSFAAIFPTIADGDPHIEASRLLHELLKACRVEAIRNNSNSSGELVIKIKASVDPAQVATIGCDVSSKPPKPKRPKATMWLTKGGNLTPESPRKQGELFRDVSAPAQPAQVDQPQAQPRSI